jgi:hypothetical protein
MPSNHPASLGRSFAGQLNQGRPQLRLRRVRVYDTAAGADHARPKHGIGTSSPKALRGRINPITELRFIFGEGSVNRKMFAPSMPPNHLLPAGSKGPGSADLAVGTTLYAPSIRLGEEMCWDQKLARRLVLHDGRKLTTLREAAEAILNLRRLRNYSASDFAIEVLGEAERNGKRADVEAATKFVTLALRHENLLVEEATPD